MSVACCTWSSLGSTPLRCAIARSVPGRSPYTPRKRSCFVSSKACAKPSGSTPSTRAISRCTATRSAWPPGTRVLNRSTSKARRTIRTYPQAPVTGPRLDAGASFFTGSGCAGAEEFSEVGDGEGDCAAFGGEDEAFLDEPVAGRGQGLRFAVEGVGYLGGGDGAVVDADAQFGHGAHVLAFRRSRTFVPGAEEPDRELGGRLGRRDGNVLDRDGRSRRVVPGGVRERRPEVRVPAGRRVEPPQRLSVVLNAPALGRPHQRAVAGLAGHPVHTHVGEEPLRVGLAGSQYGGQMR